MDIIGTVIGTGVTLAGLIVASHWRLSTRLSRIEGRLDIPQDTDLERAEGNL